MNQPLSSTRRSSRSRQRWRKAMQRTLGAKDVDDPNKIFVCKLSMATTSADLTLLVVGTFETVPPIRSPVFVAEVLLPNCEMLFPNCFFGCGNLWRALTIHWTNPLGPRGSTVLHNCSRCTDRRRRYKLPSTRKAGYDKLHPKAMVSP